MLVSTAIAQSLKPFHALSITYDNGLEFANYKGVTAATGAAAFFCHPYHAWEKGTVENSIGLLREYHPKKSPITASVTVHKATQKQLNHRPRKVLGFSTPNSLVDFILKPVKLRSDFVADPVAL
jgi:IS30 family transposase